MANRRRSVEANDLVNDLTLTAVTARVARRLDHRLLNEHCWSRNRIATTVTFDHLLYGYRINKDRLARNRIDDFSTAITLLDRATEVGVVDRVATGLSLIHI